MNKSGIRYELLREGAYDAARELLSDDLEAGEDILRVLAAEPELFVAAYREDKLVGLAQANNPVLEAVY